MKQLANYPIFKFKISHYGMAIAIGILASLLAPREAVIERRQLVDCSPASLLNKKWWETPASICHHRVPLYYPWVQYWKLDDERQWRTLTLCDFRCKGQGGNPPIIIEEMGAKKYLFDCWGFEHGLPWVWHSDRASTKHAGQEYIPLILIELLNALQTELKGPLVIISAHRCPAHHAYVTQGKGLQNDLHLIGAAVDFYIPHIKEKEVVIDALKAFCQKRASFKDALIEKAPHQWSNTEIEVSYYNAEQECTLEHPKRDYFKITARYDYFLKKSIRFSYEQARLLPLK